MTSFIAAAIQMDSQDDKRANLAAAEGYIREAAAGGAQLVVLPESMNYIGRNMAQEAESIPEGPTFQRLSSLARELGLWLEAGSIYERNPEDPDRPFNTAFLVDPRGLMVAKYSKLHPFDVVLPNGVTSRESDRVAPGHAVVTVDTEWFRAEWPSATTSDSRKCSWLMALEGGETVSGTGQLHRQHREGPLGDSSAGPGH